MKAGWFHFAPLEPFWVHFSVQKKETAAMREEKWKAKMERSPFHVDLLAEHERIDEVPLNRGCWRASHSFAHCRKTGSAFEKRRAGNA